MVNAWSKHCQTGVGFDNFFTIRWALVLAFQLCTERALVHFCVVGQESLQCISFFMVLHVDSLLRGHLHQALYLFLTCVSVYGARTIQEEAVPLPDDSSMMEMNAEDMESFSRSRGRREHLERQQSQVLTERMSSPNRYGVWNFKQSMKRKGLTMSSWECFILFCRAVKSHQYSEINPGISGIFL